MATPVLDHDNLAMLKDLIGDDLKAILESFNQQTQSLVEQIETAIANKDGDTLTHQAHTLKGSAANVGAHPLSEQAYRLETAGKQQDFSQTHQALKTLQSLADEAIEESQRFLEQF